MRTPWPKSANPRVVVPLIEVVDGLPIPPTRSEAAVIAQAVAPHVTYFVSQYDRKKYWRPDFYGTSLQDFKVQPRFQGRSSATHFSGNNEITLRRWPPSVRQPRGPAQI